jgi:hypothetical protein
MGGTSQSKRTATGKGTGFMLHSPRHAGYIRVCKVFMEHIVCLFYLTQGGMFLYEGFLFLRDVVCLLDCVLQ